MTRALVLVAACCLVSPLLGVVVGAVLSFHHFRTMKEKP